MTHYRVPSNRSRRYDKMRRLPAALLVLGDAVCSFNPIYGQGMTVAAVEALVLRDCLRRGGENLPGRFFRSSAKAIRVAWQTAVRSDLALPEVEGAMPLSMRLSNGYLEQVMSAAEVDPVVMLQMLRVIGMIDPPTRFLVPSFIFRVLRAKRLSYRRAHSLSATHGDAGPRPTTRDSAGTSITR